MKIYTLTLNPAFDLHCVTETFVPHGENLVDATDFDAGGKGVNVARALTENGVDQTAFILLGEENRAAFESAIQKDKIRYQGIPVKGRIRENVTLHEKFAPETRISFRGFTAGKETLDLLEARLSDLKKGDIVTLTGRNPDGMQIEDVKAFCARLTRRGVRLVIDSRSFSLTDLLEVKPWLIKPNQEEISSYLGRDITTFDDLRGGAEELHRAGIANVMVSLGAKGAYLRSSEGEFQVAAPNISAVSTVGAGDSSIAGFLAAFKEGKSSRECLCRAVAYGTAACLTSGTRPPEPAKIKEILKSL